MPAKKSGIKSKRPPTGRRTGRPPKLDEPLTERIAALVRAGNYVEVAAATVGINRETFYRWLREGARILALMEEGKRKRYTKHERMMADFSNTIEAARAQAESMDVLRIGKAAEHDWRAAAWRLERREPDRWGKRTDATVAVVDAGQVDSPELRTRLVDSLLRLGANGESIPPIPAPAEDDDDD